MTHLLAKRTASAALLVLVLSLAPVPSCHGEPSTGTAQSASEAPSAWSGASDAEGRELEMSFKAVHRLPVPGPDAGAEALDTELFLGAQTIKGKPYSHAAAPFQEVSRPRNPASGPSSSVRDHPAATPSAGHTGADGTPRVAVPAHAPARSNVVAEAVRKAESLDTASKKMTSWAVHSEGGTEPEAAEVPSTGYPGFAPSIMQALSKVPHDVERSAATHEADGKAKGPAADPAGVTSAYVRAVEQRGQPPRADTGRRRESHATRTDTHAAKGPVPGAALPNVTSPHVRAVDQRGQPPRADNGRRRESHATRNATHAAKSPSTVPQTGHPPVSTSAEEQAIAAALLLEAILGQQVRMPELIC